MPDLVEEALIDHLAVKQFDYRQKSNRYQIDFTYSNEGDQTGLLTAESKAAALSAGEPVAMRMRIARVEKESDKAADDGAETKKDEEEDVEYAVEFIRKEGDQADFLDAYHTVKDSVLSFAIERLH